MSKCGTNAGWNAHTKAKEPVCDPCRLAHNSYTKLWRQRTGRSTSTLQPINTAKRLTDSELSAELFRQTSWLGAIGRTYATDAGRNIVIEAAFTFGPVTRDEHEWMTLSNFVNLPHYDEVSV